MSAMECRSCRLPLGERVLDLGSLPAADHFPLVGSPEPDPTWPLELWCCTGCGLVQLRPDVRTGVEEPLAVESATMQALAESAVGAVVQACGLAPGARVAEIASHHGGSWLPALQRRGMVIEETDAPVDLLVDVHALAHEDDTDGHVATWAARLRPDGHLAAEFHHLLPLVTEGQYDTVRHGHAIYPSVTALLPALRRHGLAPVSVHRSPAYGGSLRLMARKSDADGAADGSVAAVLHDEQRTGIADPRSLRVLQRRADSAASALRGYLEAARAEGRTVLGYGAPSKACVLLGYAGVGADLLPWTVDIAPAKHGRALPGRRVPIRAVDDLVAAAPDDVLVLTWDITEEVVAQLTARGLDTARFVVPLPEVHVVTGG